jgi:hypothetical protein
MRLIARLALPWGLGFALLLGSGGGCSSDDGPRDQNYGTDAGAGYRLPDASAKDAEIDAPVVDGKMDTAPETDGSGADAGPDAELDATASD